MVLTRTLNLETKICFKWYFVLAREKKFLVWNFIWQLSPQGNENKLRINFWKLGFMEKLTNLLLEWCGWEDFKRFPWSFIDHDHTLPSTHTGGCRQKPRCFQLPRRPGGVSGRWGRVRAWSSAGWGPHEQPELGVLPARSPDMSCPIYPGWASSPQPVTSSKVSLYHTPEEGVKRIRGRGKRETRKVMGFFLFSLELNIVHRSCKRNRLLVGGYGFTSLWVWKWSRVMTMEAPAKAGDWASGNSQWCFCAPKWATLLLVKSWSKILAPLKSLASLLLPSVGPRFHPESCKPLGFWVFNGSTPAQAALVSKG